MKEQSNQTTILGTCPICGHGKLHTCQKGWSCDNTKCSFILNSLYCGASITEKNAYKLINGWVTGFIDFENPKKRKYRARLKLDADGKLSHISSQSHSTELRCPNCRGKIRETDKCFVCEHSGSKTCNFIVWRDWHKHRFTLRDMADLSRDGKTAVFSDFQDKLGKSYMAFLVINEAGKPVLKRIRI